MNIDDFHYMVGKLMMFCQCIENDVKWIYCCLAGGSVESNYREIEREALGPVLIRLKELDEKRRSPLFSARDYKVLGTIRFVRNYWAHEAYTEFVYKTGKEQTDSFIRVSKQLKDELEDLKSLSKILENTRLEMLSKI